MGTMNTHKQYAKHMKSQRHKVASGKFEAEVTEIFREALVEKDHVKRESLIYSLKFKSMSKVITPGIKEDILIKIEYLESIDPNEKELTAKEFVQKWRNKLQNK